MTTRPSRPWLLPALIALILAIGNLTANWVAADLQETLEPVRGLTPAGAQSAAADHDGRGAYAQGRAA